MEEIQKLDKQVEDLQKKRDALVAKRRSLVEDTSKEQPPRDAFESRLAQLRMEHPSWRFGELDWGYGQESDGEMEYYVQVANCPGVGKKLDFLEDPDDRYRIVFQRYEKDAHFEQGGFTVYLCEGTLYMPIEKESKKRKT